MFFWDIVKLIFLIIYRIIQCGNFRFEPLNLIEIDIISLHMVDFSKISREQIIWTYENTE